MTDIFGRTTGDVGVEFHEIGGFSDLDRPQARFGTELVGGGGGCRMDELFDGDALLAVEKGFGIGVEIHARGANLDAFKRVGLGGDGIIAGHGNLHAQVIKRAVGIFALGALRPEIMHLDLVKIDGVLKKPVGVDDRKNAQFFHAANLFGRDHLQVSQGVAGIGEAGATLGFFDDVERQRNGGVADGMKMHGKPRAVGTFDDVFEFLDVTRTGPPVLAVIGRVGGKRFVEKPRAALDHPVDEHLDVGEVKHRRGGGVAKRTGMGNFGFGIVTGVDHVPAKDVHFEAARPRECLIGMIHVEGVVEVEHDVHVGSVAIGEQLVLDGQDGGFVLFDGEARDDGIDEPHGGLAQTSRGIALAVAFDFSTGITFGIAIDAGRTEGRGVDPVGMPVAGTDDDGLARFDGIEQRGRRSVIFKQAVAPPHPKVDVVIRMLPDEVAKNRKVFVDGFRIEKVRHIELGDLAPERVRVPVDKTHGVRKVIEL